MNKRIIPKVKSEDRVRLSNGQTKKPILLPQFIRRIILFFYYLTPKGRKEKYWLNAEKNMQKALYKKGLQEIEVKKECVKTAEKITKKKQRTKYFKPKFSKFKLASLVAKTHEKGLADVRVAIDPNSLEFKDVKHRI